VEDRTIRVSHCSEQSFLDSFRSDLAACVDHLLILSPFLSNNRALHYYPALRSLIARGVMIDVYTRPRAEQPESLREHYDEVQRNLKSLGVQVHLRSGMHEKVGVVDGRVLWHGSLNIFSHNDTRESMLRFESPELVEEVLADIGLGTHPGIGREGLAASDAIATGIEPGRPASVCPVCGDSMLLFEEAGMWICARSPKCAGVVSIGDSPSRAAGSVDQRPLDLCCPICGSAMEISQGVERRIVCASESCAFSFDRRISAGLLRVLRRRSAV
jgi:hypothetical protein